MSYIFNFELLDGKKTIAKGSAIDKEINLDKLLASVKEFCRVKIHAKNENRQ